MAKLYIRESFQHKGKVYRTNDEGNIVLKISAEKLDAEIALGKVTKTVKGKKVERWVSGVLNHCVPADREAKKIILGMKFDDEADDGSDSKQKEAAENQRTQEEQAKADEKEKKEIHAELEKLGKAANKRLGLPKLRAALQEARIATGEQKEEKQQELEA